MDEKREMDVKRPDFIAVADIDGFLSQPPADRAFIREVISKSLEKNALGLDEVAALVSANDQDIVEEILDAARTLKKTVYGNRIVIFAPLYIGNECINDCAYCAFKRSNRDVIRRTLAPEDITKQVEALEDDGHKRLILVFGESPDYDGIFISECVRTVYGVKRGWGEVRRVNISAAPMDIEEYRKVKSAGIGTYQIFQETYHRPTYARYHPKDTRKSDYMYRLHGLGRAMEAGIDDVGIGALFGLSDWRYEVMGLVSHALFLQKEYGVGPHTVSFPRLKKAKGVSIDERRLVCDDDFKRLVAILRLAIPYTGMILTAREPPHIRREVMHFGVSQIDAGSRIEIGGYTEMGDGDHQRADCEQFLLGDLRSLDEIIRELLLDGFMPSFCTSCYRVGRTGKHFMEYAIPGFIKRYCMPNAMLTLMEYLIDYASSETRSIGFRVIRNQISEIEDAALSVDIMKRLIKIKSGCARDIYF